MYCPKCGKELPEGAQFCPTCGSSINQPELSPQSQDSSSPDQDIPSINLQGAAAEQQNQPPVPNEEIKCPRCGATGCTPQYKQNVSGGGYGCCSGGLGALVLGPLGLLCGACGRSVKSTNTLVWICPNCGHEFQVMSEDQKKKVYPSCVTLVCIAGFLAMVAAYITGTTTALPNTHWDGLSIVYILFLSGVIIWMGFQVYKNPFITDEQKVKLKIIAIVMGIIAFICFVIPFIFVASVQRARA